VTSTPGAITGDSAFQPRAVSLTVSADGTLSSGFMGGWRFEAITLTAPGTVVLHGAGLRFGGGYLATAADYRRSLTAPSVTGPSGPATSRSKARASPTLSVLTATTTSSHPC